MEIFRLTSKLLTEQEEKQENENGKKGPKKEINARCLEKSLRITLQVIETIIFYFFIFLSNSKNKHFCLTLLISL